MSVSVSSRSRAFTSRAHPCHDLPECQLNRPQLIQNSLARAVTTTEHEYLYDLISLQPFRNTLAHPPLHSSLKVNNHSFRHASPRLWNELPKELRQPIDDESLSLSSHFFSHQLIIIIILISTFTMHALHLCSTPDSKLTFSINLSHHSLPHTFSDGSHGFLRPFPDSSSVSLSCFSLFILFCLIHVID